MKHHLLFPSYFKAIGAVLFIVFVLLFIAWTKFEFQFPFLTTGKPVPGSLENLFEDHNFTNELIGIGLLISLIFIAFAKEKREDERTQIVRLKSLHISHYLNYFLFAMALLLFNGLSFIGIVFYLPYVFLITFIVVYYCKLHLFSKFARYEE